MDTLVLIEYVIGVN